MTLNDNGADRIVRVHIAAKVAHCSSRTIRRRIQERKLPAFRVGRRAWGIRFADLQRMLEQFGGQYA